MTSCTWSWGDSASLWPSAHREELRRPGARPTPSAKTLATLGGERVSSTAAGRIAATGRERTLYAAAALSLLTALVHLGVTPEHFGALRGVVGLRDFLSCGCRSPDTLRPDRAALTDPDSLTFGHRGQPRDRGAVPADTDGGDSFFRTRGRGGGGIRLCGRVCHGIRAGNRGSARRSAIAQRPAREKAYDRAHRGHRAGLGRSRGAPSAACLLSLEPRG